MKKIFLLIAVLALSLVVVACGAANKNNNQTQDKQNVEDNNNDVTNGTAGNAGTDGNAGTNGTDKNTGANTNKQTNAENSEGLAKMDELDYLEFNLDIEYGTQDEYDVELERNKDGTIEAEIEDSINGVRKEGTDAFNELYPLVKKLTIDQQTSKEDAITEVLDVFNLKNDYTKFEVDITFKDGTKIEFVDTK
ncbi:YusW family protein [Sporosarcina jiandibaonis]|uniref:YusW family protein n=1 Tax=Sporosarcina jiandibaonis TaxID=2715535 RepID=UPI0015526580|nr:YusW family protein [Sporosarcina jiandibaonis]